MSLLKWSIDAAIVMVFVGVGQSARAQTPEVRATWLTTTGVDHIASGNNTESIMGQLRAVGLNTVYVESWKNGYTQYPSQTLQDLIGLNRTPGLISSGRDLLDETLIHAHRNNMQHIAWFEYGFSPQFIGNGGNPSNPLANYMKNQGWLLQDQNGQYANASNAFAWMNPAVPEVRQFLIDITLESIREYDLDGIQFDDRLSWPNEFGFDPTTIALYTSETGNAAPTNPNNSAFKQWRQDKVTLFAQELTTAIRAERPDFHISVSPSVNGFAQDRFNADWPEWMSQGLFDETVVQLYRPSLATFRRDLPAQLEAAESAGALDELIVGISFTANGTTPPIADIQQMIVDIALAENGQLPGHAMFFSEGVIDNAASLTSFYGPDRDNPFFPTDWRPDPLVATQDTSDPAQWDVVVTEAGRYRVIAEINGRWQTIESLVLGAGLASLDVAGATEVELLVDRRGLPGDYNGDGLVGQADLDLVLQHWGETVAAGESPDAQWINTLDLEPGVIGQDDLAWVLRFWGEAVPVVAEVSAIADATGLTESQVRGLIPEPGTLALLTLGLVGLLRRHTA